MRVIICDFYGGRLELWFIVKKFRSWMKYWNLKWTGRSAIYFLDQWFVTENHLNALALHCGMYDDENV